MIKNISVIEFEKNKKVQVLINEPMSFGELFDISMELRQIAINGINEIAKQDADKAEAEKVSKVEPINVPKEFTE